MHALARSTVFRTITPLLIATGASPQGADAQSSLDRLQSLWSAGKYDSVITPLAFLRDSVAPDARLRVDYLLVTSLCRSVRVERREKGAQLLTAVQAHYSAVLGDSARAWLRAEATRCAPAAPVESAPRMASAEVMPRPVAEINISGGKAYYDPCGRVGGQGSEILRGARPIGAAALAARLRPLSALSLAMADARALAERVRLDVTVDTVAGRYVIASYSEHSPRDVRRIGMTLEAYRRFFARTYGLRLPDSVVTVLLVPEDYALRRVAETWHGVQPGYTVIGYSIVSDLSMVGIIPARTQGTLAHELMHLMLSYSYPDAPPWLNEGLASLYEVSRPRPDSTIEGMPNWRGRVLAAGRQRLPRLDSLFAATDATYRGLGEQRNQLEQALVYAQSRYFVLFLQRQGLLPDFVRAMRARSIVAPDESAAGLSIALPGTALARATLAAIAPGRDLAAEYAAWLRRELAALPADSCRGR